jgi:hypothetical protein
MEQASLITEATMEQVSPIAGYLTDARILDYVGDLYPLSSGSRILLNVFHRSLLRLNIKGHPTNWMATIDFHHSLRLASQLNFPKNISILRAPSPLTASRPFTTYSPSYPPPPLSPSNGKTPTQTCLQFWARHLSRAGPKLLPAFEHQRMHFSKA